MGDPPPPGGSWTAWVHSFGWSGIDGAGREALLLGGVVALVLLFLAWRFWPSGDEKEEYVAPRKKKRRPKPPPTPRAKVRRQAEPPAEEAPPPRSAAAEDFAVEEMLAEHMMGAAGIPPPRRHAAEAQHAEDEVDYSGGRVPYARSPGIHTQSGGPSRVSQSDMSVGAHFASD